jgi:hydrogenase expression/formation protein HypC
MCLGVPGRITDVRDDRGTRMATVDFGGVTKDVCLAYVPDAQVGEYTLIHAGFAITMVDEVSALQTLELFEQLGLLEEELGVPAEVAIVDRSGPASPEEVRS